MNREKDKKIILFDGVCNLCNGAVMFIIRRDGRDQFRFAALQSKPGNRIVNKYGIDTSKTDSVILVEEENYFVKSAAVLKIARNLSGGYPLLYGLMIFPKAIRDWIYDVVANNRYQWFGKRGECMVPTQELKAKFLDG